MPVTKTDVSMETVLRISSTFWATLASAMLGTLAPCVTPLQICATKSHATKVSCHNIFYINIITILYLLGVECIPSRNAYFCGQCPTGMTGNGINCTDISFETDNSTIKYHEYNGTIIIDPCLSSPCFPNVSCFPFGQDKSDFLCGNCPAGMTGDGINCSKFVTYNY